MVVLIIMTNTSHKTNVEDLLNFGITKTEFQNSKQSLMTERLMIGNTDGLNIEYFICLLMQYLEKACTDVLNRSEWEQYGVYPFDHAPAFRVFKVDVAAYAEALAADEPLKFSTRSSAPLTYLNANVGYALTIFLATKIYHKHRRAEATSTVQVEIDSGSY